ncbi:MAG: type I methionyl aminopeptidase [Deltaproteobacteria bacterium]|nr:type I methionyl aminopeptidase [Deltaproteobacteria bacterium]
MIFLKSPQEIEIMRTANRIVTEILAELRERVAPGISTGEIDRIASDLIRKKGARSAFKGYQIRNGSVPFPATICVSLNNEVVHGIPSFQRIIRAGDLVSLDFGVIYRDFYGDAAVSFTVGEGNGTVRRLLETTAAALEDGIAQARVGNRLGDISAAVQERVEREGFAVVREFVGHGVGRRLHEDPPVPNYGARDRGVRLREGMVLAIEPMVNAGGPEVALKSDGWTAVTRDGSLSAHFEHSVAITEKGPEVLSRL